MSLSDYLTPQGKRIKKEAFVHLVQISRIDGKTGKEEMDRLHWIGRKFGLTEPEIEKLIQTERSHHYVPPYSLEEKFDHLYDMAKMILADEVVKEGEKKMLKRFLIESGFADSKINCLLAILIDGVKEKTEEEVLYKKFQKKVLH